MKLSKNIREIVLSLGIVLIALRLFFPVQEYQLYQDGSRVNHKILEENSNISAYEKSVVVSKTIFQSFGIAVLTVGFVLVYNLGRKQMP